MKEQKDEGIRGDKLRRLIFLVYLNSKYGTGKFRISDLKKTVGYEGQGIYNILESSGFFEVNTTRNEIHLTKHGMEYVERRWIPYFSALNPVSYFLIALGSLFLIHWYLRTFANIIIVFDLYSGLALIAGAIVLRFLLLRILFWTLRLWKKL